uniref:Phospholipase A2 inhibitor and Ly6/PLAUR domain-containing protein-like n=1 Tax=Sphenodon punctatus TaxID=8508 RepID=A0A8D0HFN5_SPHPU
MRALFSFCLLSALLATGTPLSCFHCKPGDRNCNVPQPCSHSQNACLIIWEGNTLGEAQVAGSSSSCINTAEAFMGLAAYYFGIKEHILIYSEVCVTDHCNMGIMSSLPPVNTVRNGLQCPGCYAPGFSHCDDSHPLRCLGISDKCIRMAGTLEGGGAVIPFAASGCATETACQIKSLQSGVFTYNLTQVQCNPAPKAMTSNGIQNQGWVPFALHTALPMLSLIGLHLTESLS